MWCCSWGPVPSPPTSASLHSLFPEAPCSGFCTGQLGIAASCTHLHGHLHMDIYTGRHSGLWPCWGMHKSQCAVSRLVCPGRVLISTGGSTVRWCMLDSHFNIGLPQFSVTLAMTVACCTVPLERFRSCLQCYRAITTACSVVA